MWISSHFGVTLSTTLAKALKLCQIIFILWLIFFEWTQMTFSLCWFSDSLMQSRFLPLVTYNCNGDAFNPLIHNLNFATQWQAISASFARRDSTSDLCCVTQEEDVQITVWCLSHRKNNCTPDDCFCVIFKT